jgi:ribosomal protein S18 acetylase RimI-like enzyme
MADPKLALYVQSWGRTGDAGVVAEDQTGRPLGAAWYRLFTSDEHGYGFVDVAIPELTVAVKAEVRDRGVGTALLQGLVERARVDGVPALSLSVEEDNPALSLYERLGFVVVGRIENAWTMRRDLD